MGWFGQTNKFVIVNKFWIKANAMCVCVFAWWCAGLLLFLSLRSLISLLHMHRHRHSRTCMHINTHRPEWTLVVLTHLNDFTHSDSFSWFYVRFSDVVVFFCIFFSLFRRCCYFFISLSLFFQVCYFSQSFDRSSWENNALLAMHLLRDVIFVLFSFSFVFFVFFGMYVYFRWTDFFFQGKYIFFRYFVCAFI